MEQQYSTKGITAIYALKKWDSSNRYFVTRKKDNASYEVGLDFYCSNSKGINKDQPISLNYKDKRVSRTVKVRLVTYSDPESDEILEFITNLKGLEVQTIALLYKNGWVKEVLFMQIKQNFELKYQTGKVSAPQRHIF